MLFSICSLFWNDICTQTSYNVFLIFFKTGTEQFISMQMNTYLNLQSQLLNTSSLQTGYL